MGRIAVKKSPSKRGKSPVDDRRSASRSPKSEIKSSSSDAGGSQESIGSTPYTHVLPTQEQRRGNGRFQGRSLIKWNRPKMAEKLLLHLHYECTRHKITLPWDAIAHRLHPGSSGAAILQHFNRMRRELLSDGHLVPPLGNKPGTGQPDVEIRGYVRVEGGDNNETRAVKFSEAVEDPRFSLPGSFEEADEPLDSSFTMQTPRGSEREVPRTPSFSNRHESSGMHQMFSPPPPGNHYELHSGGGNSFRFPRYDEGPFAPGPMNTMHHVEDPFRDHHVSDAHFSTPRREQKHFVPMTPEKTPYGTMDPGMYGYHQGYIFSPLQFGNRPGMIARSHSSSHSTDGASEAPAQLVPAKRPFSTDPESLEEPECERPSDAKALLDDLMLSGRNDDKDTDCFLEA